MSVDAVQQPAKLKAGQVVVVGRIVSRRRSEGGRWYTQIQTPAPDEYSHPAFLDVGSAAKLGDPGEEVRVVCNLAGKRRTFQVDDGHGGRVNAASSNMWLTAVE